MSCLTAINKIIRFEYECPICGKRIADDYMDGNRFDYCMHCGQALDWSDKK